MIQIWLEEKHNLSPMWRKLMKLVGLGEPTSFLDHVYLGCTQRECKSNECIIEEYRKMFETRLSAGPAEKLPGWEKFHAKTVAWSYDIEGHAKKCVKRYCGLVKKTTQLFTKSQRHAWMINKQGRTKRVSRRIVHSLLTNCSEMSFFWHVLGDLIICGL